MRAAQCGDHGGTYHPSRRHRVRTTRHHGPAGRQACRRLSGSAERRGGSPVVRCRGLPQAHDGHAGESPRRGGAFFGLTPARLSLVVPPDGRPVLTLPDARTAAPSLIACQTPDCGRATVRSLSGLQPWITGPALTLDPAGLPVVAFRDNSVPGIALVGCEHLGCARWETVSDSDRPRLWEGRLTWRSAPTASPSWSGRTRAGSCC